MESMRSLKFTSAIIVLIIMFCISEEEGRDWRQFCSNQKGTFLYDGENITNPEKNYITVWTKFVFNKQGRHWAAKHYRKNHKDIHQVFVLFGIDCSRKRICVEESTFDSHDGSPVSSLNVPSDFAFIEPDSVKEGLYKICDQKPK
jgi:hypothetical protein